MVTTTTIIVITAGVLGVLALGLGLGLGLKNSDDDSDVTTMAPMPDTTAQPGPDPTTQPNPDTKKPYTLRDYIDKTYKGKSVNPNWVPKGVSSPNDIPWSDLYFHTNAETGDIELYDFNTMEMDSTFMANTKNDKYVDENGDLEAPFDFYVSTNAAYAFFGFNFRKVWRTTSFYANYELYDISSQQYIDSIFDDAQLLDHCPEGKSMVQYLKFSPAEDNSGVFVCGFNLYHFTDPADFGTVTPITTDGKENEIYNGIPEWAYQEEIIGGNNVINFSKDGSKIMFIKFTTQTHFADNGSDEHIYKYSWYGNDQYPETLEISYAKAGTNPSKNNMYVIDVATKTVNDLSSLQPYENEDNYYYRADWNGSKDMVVVWTNRVQNESTGVFFTCNDDLSWSVKADQGNARIYKEENGWVGSFGPWYPFFDMEDQYVTIRSKKVESTANNNIRNQMNRDEAEAIPEGFWTVARVDRGSDDIVWLADHAADYTDTDLIHWDEETDNLFYYAAFPEPRHRQIHMVSNAFTGDGNVEPIPVSQALLDAHPDRCGWININLHEDNVIFNCAGGKGLPASFKKKVNQLAQTDYDSFTMIEGNTDLQEMLDEVAYPNRDYGKFASSKYPEKEYNYVIFTPENFDNSGAKKYKLVIEVYAGPEFQKVTDTWSPDFCQSMVSEYDIICASVDGRGSAFEGDRFMQQIYLKLGQYEPIDQTDFAKYMGSMDFIDADNIAIWGWSYGGYTTTHTLAYNNNGEGTVFKCGVAVAPLASWRYYDIVYAERYLRTPAENEEGYDRAEVWWHWSVSKENCKTVLSVTRTI